MIRTLHLIFSLPFLLGFIAGMAAYWGFLWEHSRWRNKHDPLPGGKRWPLGGLNATYISIAVVLAVIGYIVMSTQDTHDQTLALAKDVSDCQTEFNTQMAARSLISGQDAELANRQLELRAEGGDARDEWLARILNPPADIAAQPPGDPLRAQWNYDMTKEYADKTLALSLQIKGLLDQRRKLKADRESHPLPTSNCPPRGQSGFDWGK